jgi:hypothetical protein
LANRLIGCFTELSTIDELLRADAKELRLLTLPRKLYRSAESFSPNSAAALQSRGSVGATHFLADQ